LGGKHFKWIEFVLLAVGAVIGASLPCKLVELPVAVYRGLCVETKMLDLTIRIKKSDEVGGKRRQAGET
jgi:hypothetical protein